MTSQRLDHKGMARDNETLHEVVQFLFGDGAFETFSKSSPDGSELSTHQAKKNKRQAQIGLASNAVGIAAGIGATGSAIKDLKSTEPGPVTGRALKYVKTPRGKARLIAAGAGGALALQGANLVGDAVANRVLNREAKKDVHLKKMHEKDPRRKWVDKDAQGIPLGVHGQLVRVTVNEGPRVKAGAQKVVEVTRPAAQKTAEITMNTARAGAEKTKPLVQRVKDKLFKAEVEIGEISKLDSDKRQVFGWASIVERDGQPVVDLQGDYISVEEIEKAAYSYVMKSRKGGNQHQRNGDEPLHVSDMIESFIITPEKREALGIPESTPTGWWVGFQVHDDETWGQIKRGERAAFSVHGRGKRTPL